MNEIILHTEYLLQRYDCVIIPTIGAVLAHYTPAAYDEATHTWSAPSRTVSFTADLNRTDGLLCGSIARRNGISFDAASRIIATETDVMRHQLEAEGALSLGRVGTLHSSNGSVSFEPGDMRWLVPESMWLPALHTSETAAVQKAVDEYTRTLDNARRAWRKFARTASVVAGIVTICALGLFMMRNNSAGGDKADQFASLAPVEMAVAADAPSDLLIERPGTQDASPALVVILRQADDAVTEVDTAAVSARRLAAKAATAKADGPRRYCLIVASLASQAEARKYILEQHDPSLRVLAKDGRFRVYAATADTQSDVMAIADAKKLAERYPDAWICRR